MAKIFRHIGKATVLAGCGGMIYACIELLWRGYSHWTMAVLGGVCFLLVGGINNWFPWDMSLLLQGVIGSAVVLIGEFGAGMILNVHLGMGIWDYSNLPGNILGQVCPQFAAVWMLLSIAAVVVDDWLRYWLFGEERPKYHFI